MTKLKMTVAALAMAAAAGVAYAQDSTVPPNPAPEQPTAAAPADPVPSPSMDTATQPTPPVDQNTAQQPTPPVDQNTAQQQTPPADNNAAGTEIDKTQPSTAALPQSINPDTSFLASKFIGQMVYSAANENVGDINDLIVSKDSDQAIVAVIGVGGFLGMGEKDVAVPMDRITVTTDENKQVRLTINATREELDAAPAFDRTALFARLN